MLPVLSCKRRWDPAHADRPALLVELKYGGSAKWAIAQIRRRNYPQRLEHYRGNLLLVGVNYDREAKTHECLIERWQG